MGGGLWFSCHGDLAAEEIATSLLAIFQANTLQLLWDSVLMRYCYPSSGEFEIKLLDQLLEDMCSDRT